MKRPSEKQLGIIFCVVLVTLLALPSLKWLLKPARVIHLYGYTDPIPNKPTRLLQGFINKSSQLWIEKFFNAKIGFREGLIRTFNEICFRIFREAASSRLKIVTTKNHGLYSNLSIDSLNKEVINKKMLDEKYTLEADKLLKLQNNFQAQGKYFVVVIASSKAYIYPQELGSRYLVGGSTNLFKRAASFGNILKAKGVNVIDSGPLLRHLVRESHLETHPVSGLHWNHAVGCLIAKEIMNSAQQFLHSGPILECGTLQRIKPPVNNVDLDGYLLLNIWTSAGLLKHTTFPTISTQITQSKLRPKIVFIGDSFSDQIRFAFEAANIYSKFVFSSYFKTREVTEKPASNMDPNNIVADEIAARSTLLADIEESNLIVLELVDYNVTYHLTYGFSDYVLEHSSHEKLNKTG